MASFDYFATFDESISILREVSALGLHVVAEPRLADEPKALVFEQVTHELVEILRAGPVVYLTGSFTRSPVQFSRLQEGAGAGKYFIDQITQGPIMKMLVSRVNLVDGERTLLPGRISHRASHVNPESRQAEKASPELKAAYRRVISTVKNSCSSHPYKPGVEIFISSEALGLLRRGEARIIDDQIVPGGRG